MVFSSAIFLPGFLPVTFLCSLLIRKDFSNAFLLAASLVFYSWGEPYYILLMVFSIAVNWGTGAVLSSCRGGTRKAVLGAGILCDLGILGYYKYSAFFAETANCIMNAEILPVVERNLPIVISFYTFQAVSYLIDVYRGETEASRNPVYTALYISFFPQLIAGPIVKYRDISRQIEDRSVCTEDVSEGFRRFLCGLGKKVLIANTLGLCVDSVYALDIEAVDCAAAWIASLCYTFQIYYDFSGYSDMAIGLGRMFGFRIPENFRYPYLSGSVSEFWRRWHISLGAWFRESTMRHINSFSPEELAECGPDIVVYETVERYAGNLLAFSVMPEA